MIPTFTPTMLATFERCPHQYEQKYVQKNKVAEPFNSALACGNAAHSVLAGVLEVYRRTGGLPIDLRERVERELPRLQYLVDAAWQTDVEQVVGWVKWALGSLDETAKVLLVERWLEYLYPGNGDCPPFRLRHRIDLGLQHADGTIEHLDWKTGTRTEVDALQNVAARIVFRHAFPDRSRVLSSTAFLTSAVMQTDELTREQVKAEWDRLKRLVADVRTERDWLPFSNALCPWCPYYQRGCALYRSPDGGSDTTTIWLEGAA
jgi:RecB family exonuclease